MDGSGEAPVRRTATSGGGLATAWRREGEIDGVEERRREETRRGEEEKRSALVGREGYFRNFVVGATLD